jgi:hypothetical protein
MRFQPNETDKARFNHKYRYEEKAAFITHIRPKDHLRKRLPRSSYAFAQQEGWGPLIISGRMKVKPLTDARISHDIHVRLFLLSFIFNYSFFLDEQKKSITFTSSY